MSVATSHNVAVALGGALLWALWSAICGYALHRVPDDRLGRDRGILRLLHAERGGRVYERRLHIKRWKDRLPEAGMLFRGGFSKRRIDRHDHAYLAAFALATRRAELVHWGIAALIPVFVVWAAWFGMPWWLAVAMIGYGVVANAPCLAVQRYNRARLLRLVPSAPGPDTVSP
jgi:glycosyl-4,4'-diaponeurosporenoate acyltransferase